MPNEYANEPNQSRSEDIIQSILDNTEYDEEARSRIEYLLIELKNAIEGGGGGGSVTSYSPLTEKPKIDNHTLQAGNNTSSDLGLQTKLTFDSTPTENSTNPVTSGGVYTALDSKANSSDVYNKSAVDTALTAKADKSTTYTKLEVDTALSSKQNIISDLPTIRSGAALGATAVQPVSGKSLSTNDYTTADKDKLAGIEAQANKTTVDSALSGTSTNPVQNKVVKSALDGKQDTLTTGQLAAVNSGIDYDDVEQITTNKNNISLKANTSDVNTATANLQGQIDQIEISASAEAVVAPEVAAARVSSSGVEYSTLKKRLDYNEEDVSLKLKPCLTLTSDNLINITKCTDGYYCDYRNGQLVANAQNTVTDYIEIEAEQNYSFSNFTDGYGVGQCAFFDINKNFISGISNGGIPVSVTVESPEGARYIRWSFLIDFKNKVILKKGLTVTKYQPYAEYNPYIANEIATETANKAPLVDKNLIDITQTTDGYYADYRSGNLEANADFCVSDYIPVNAGENYTFSNYKNNYGVGQCCFYDGIKTYVSGLANTGTVDHVTITIPSGVSYIRWSFLIAFKNNVQLEEGSESTSYVPHGINLIPAQYIPEIPDRTTVYVGENRDYTSILAALKSGAKTVYVESGVYDIYQEYISYYGDSFWTNYNGYSGSDLEDCFMRGLWLDYGVSVIGLGDVVLTFLQDTSFNQKIKTDFAIFAGKSNITIENLTISVNGNCRYQIHDDFMAENGIVRYKNLIFKGVPYSPVNIGAGLGFDVTYEISGCVFLDDDNATYNISYHGCTANAQTKSKIFVKNCYGGKTCAFRWYGNSQKVTECYVSNCKFDDIICVAYDSSQPYENMSLVEWCNETT